MTDYQIETITKTFTCLTNDNHSSAKINISYSNNTIIKVTLKSINYSYDGLCLEDTYLTNQTMNSIITTKWQNTTGWNTYVSANNTVQLGNQILDEGFEEWSRYSRNPLLKMGKTFGSVVKNSSTYYLYYHNLADNTIRRANSSDGKIWNDENIILLKKSSYGWDSSGVGVPYVWIENGTWYMMYRGTVTGQYMKVGLATSSDGITWKKNASNPVISQTASSWDNSHFETCFAITKVSGKYYLWYSLMNPERKIGLATSTNLISWSKDVNNPIYTGNRFCADSFNYNGTYYMNVPKYTNGSDYTQLELYSSPNPTFYPKERKFLGISKSINQEKSWETKDEDTPTVFTPYINRTVQNGEVLIYYAGGNSNGWNMGLLTMPDIQTAISTYSLNWYPYSTIFGSKNTTVTKDGKYSFNLNDNSATKAQYIYNTNYNQTIGVIDFWIRTSNKNGHNGNIYLKSGLTTAAIVGFSPSGKFEFWNGSFRDTSIPYSVDTWYRIEIRFNTISDTYDFAVYDTKDILVSQKNISFGNAVKNINMTYFYTSNAFIGNNYIDTYRGVDRNVISGWRKFSLDAGINNSIDYIDVNFSSLPFGTNYTVYLDNGTDTQIGTANSTLNQSISFITKYRNIDVKVWIFGNINISPEMIPIRGYIVRNDT